MTDRQISELVESMAAKAREIERDLAEARRGLEDAIAELKRRDELRRNFTAQRKTFWRKPGGAA